MKLKQMLVIRNDLGMRKGKMVAQGAHAAVTATLDNCHQKVVADWFKDGQAKICVRVDSEQELMFVYNAAKKAGLITALITDAGHTEFHGVPTKTCCAIGPGPADQIDKITGELVLL